MLFLIYMKTMFSLKKTKVYQKNFTMKTFFDFSPENMARINNFSKRKELSLPRDDN